MTPIDVTRFTPAEWRVLQIVAKIIGEPLTETSVTAFCERIGWRPGQPVDQAAWGFLGEWMGGEGEIEQNVNDAIRALKADG